MRLSKKVFLISRIMFCSAMFAMLAMVIKAVPGENICIQIILIIPGTIFVYQILEDIYKLFKKKGVNTGNTFQIDIFDDFGNRIMSTHGTIINVIHIPKKYNETLGSQIDIKIDGRQYISNGDTLILYEEGLAPDINFKLEEINSLKDDLEDNSIPGILNKYHDRFGNSVIIIIRSLMGTPIYAFEGYEVYWKVPDNLPNFILFQIDGKELYIYRANFQIVDSELIK